MSSSDSKAKVPQDVVAIFHASFHPTQGSVVDWSLKASENLDLSHVEFSCLPSGLHLVEQDVVYFTKDEHQGVCVFRRRRTAEHGHRGFRLSSLGILLAKSTRSRPWRHVPALTDLVHSIYSSLEDRDALEPTEADWEPARTFFEERQVRRVDLGGAGDWKGWSAEVEEFDPAERETSPTLHMPHVLRILGPSCLTLYKHILGRRRVLIYTPPPVEAACILCQVAADMCFEVQVETESNAGEDLMGGSDGGLDTDVPQRPWKGKSKEGVKVLGMVTLSDLEKMEIEGRTGRGWVACTTDAIFMEKPSYYDLLIDLTTSTPYKSSRPTLYISKPVEQSSSRSPSHRLSVTRFTWSDVKLWAEIERLLQLDAPHNDCCDHSSASMSPRSRSGVGAAWADMWRVYEDVCVICAGVWMNSWRSNSPYSSANGRAENWGSIRLEGEDELTVRKGGSYSSVRNIGMGIEGRPCVAGAASDSGTLHNRTARAIRRSSGMSVWTWASGRTAAEPGASTSNHVKSISGEEDAEERRERREKGIVTTLALLQTFHANSALLLTRLTNILSRRSAASLGDSAASGTTVLTPKDVMAFELGPLSGLDGRFIEWLADEYGGGVRLVVRRSWRDLIGLVLGFG